MSALTDTQALIDEWLTDTFIKVGIENGVWWNQGRWFNVEDKNRLFMKCLPSHQEVIKHTEVSFNPGVMTRFEPDSNDSRQSWVQLVPDMAPPTLWTCTCSCREYNANRGKGFTVIAEFDWEARDMPDGPHRFFKTVEFDGLDRGKWSEWQLFEPVVPLETVAKYMTDEGWDCGVTSDDHLWVQEWILSENDLYRRAWPEDMPQPIIDDLEDIL